MEERPQKCTVHDMARQLRYIPETSIIRHVTKRNGRRTNIMAVHFDVPFLAALDFGRDPVRNNGSILYLLRVLSSTRLSLMRPSSIQKLSRFET